MDYRSKWPMVVVALVIVAVVVWAAKRHEAVENNQPGVIGNVMDGVSHKIDQVDYQLRADTAEGKAESNFNAAKAKLGLDHGSSSDAE